MYVAFDNYEVGVLQGTALLQGLAERKGDGPYNIELIAGSPDDANSTPFFEGAMSVLQPKIDDGTLVVVSGQTSFEQVATQGWKAENAQKRMDTILAGSYADTELDGVLSPNDTLGRAALTSVAQAGKETPGRHRPGLRGRVGQVDRRGRAVLDDLQGHPRAGRPDHQGDPAPAEG